MIVIHINEATQQFIADKYNQGVVPLLSKDDPTANGEDTYYLVMDHGPNDIVTSEHYWDNLFESDHKHIVIN